MTVRKNKNKILIRNTICKPIIRKFELNILLSVVILPTLKQNLGKTGEKLFFQNSNLITYRI